MKRGTFDETGQEDSRGFDRSGWQGGDAIGGRGGGYLEITHRGGEASGNILYRIALECIGLKRYTLSLLRTRRLISSSVKC